MLKKSKINYDFDFEFDHFDFEHFEDWFWNI